MDRSIRLATSTCLCLALATAAQAEVKKGSASIVLGPDYVLHDSSRDVEDAVMPVFGIGYNFTRNWGFEGNVGTFSDTVGGVDVDITVGQLGAIYHINPGDSFVGFATLGYGVRSDNRDTGDTSESMLVAGVGFKYFITENLFWRSDAKLYYGVEESQTDVGIGTSLGWQFGGENDDELLADFDPNDGDGDGIPDAKDKCPNTPAKAVVDTNGCTLRAAEPPKPTKPAEPLGGSKSSKPAAQKPTGAFGARRSTTASRSTSTTNNDSDGDGVPNHLDSCTSTKLGDEVDARGCVKAAAKPAAPTTRPSLSSRASNQAAPSSAARPQGSVATVTQNAKAQAVTRGTVPARQARPNIFGRADSSPATDSGQTAVATAPAAAYPQPAAPTANFYSDQGDSDADGVVNKIDQCPNTPRGQPVNHHGCLSSVAGDYDGDGVRDSIDECVGTPRGVAVNKRGCATGKRRSTSAYKTRSPGSSTSARDPNVLRHVELNGVMFPPNSSYFNKKTRVRLKALARELSQMNVGRVAVEGHTDSIGKRKYNQWLSARRAERVARFLSKQSGIPESRFDIYGYGESRPVADNTLEAGREKNRRVIVTAFKPGQSSRGFWNKSKLNAKANTNVTRKTAAKAWKKPAKKPTPVKARQAASTNWFAKPKKASVGKAPVARKRPAPRSLNKPLQPAKAKQRTHVRPAPKAAKVMNPPPKPRCLTKAEPGCRHVRFYTLPGSIFQRNSAVITDSGEALIDKELVVGALGPSAKFRKVEIRSFTGGMRDKNGARRLALKRAQALKDYLTDTGIRSSFIHPIGYGEAYPIADNSTAKGRARNNRIEVVVQ